VLYTHPATHLSCPLPGFLSRLACAPPPTPRVYPQPRTHPPTPTTRPTHLHTPAHTRVSPVVTRCHLILANLRKPGEKGYKIPRGFLFNIVTCANYTAEIWGWVLFSVGTQTAAAALFTAAGAYQMAVWAKQKHARLLKVGWMVEGWDGTAQAPHIGAARSLGCQANGGVHQGAWCSPALWCGEAESPQRATSAAPLPTTSLWPSKCVVCPH
jgi:hypothetical protein